MEKTDYKDLMLGKLTRCILDSEEPLINLTSGKQAEDFILMLSQAGVLVSMLNKTLDGGVMFEFINKTIGDGRYASVEFFNDNEIVYLTHMPSEGVRAWDITTDARTERLAGIAEYLGKLAKKHNQNLV